MKPVLKYLKPYRFIIAAIFFVLALEMAATLYIPTLVADIINNGVIKNDLPYVYRTGGLMLLAAALAASLATLDTYLSAKVAAGFGRDLRNQLFRKAQDFSVGDFTNIGVASMITRCTRDVSQLEQGSIMLLQMLMPAPLMMTAGLLLAFSKDRTVAFIIVATVLLFIAIAALVMLRSFPLFKKLQVGMDAITHKLRENIIGVRIIRAFNKVEREQQNANHSFEGYATLAIRVNKLFAAVMPLALLIMNLCTFFIVWVGGSRAAGGYIAVGDIMAFIEYSVLILIYLMFGVTAVMSIPQAAASAERLSEILTHLPEINDEKNNKPLISQKEVLRLENVTFSYPDAEKPVLSNLSFHLLQGQTTAIIGGTGSGKSTVASLIPRLYDVQSGTISLVGQDIKTLSQHQLREQISFAPQKPFLFSGTVEENLRFGCPDASFAQLQHAATVAQAASFIDSLEGGYGAYVAQGGNNFSGGQKQRLSIARALAKPAQIYIFDDSFSALDYKTDANLRKALKTELQHAAVLFVAQRISSIQDADQIIVIDNGSIVGIGTHTELLISCNVYQQIAASQKGKEDVA